jgi:hypothetical protein
MFMRCLARNIFVHQMKMIHPDCLILVNDVDFLECLIVSIVCIENEKFVSQLEKGCIVTM